MFDKYLNKVVEEVDAKFDELKVEIEDLSIAAKYAVCISIGLSVVDTALLLIIAKRLGR